MTDIIGWAATAITISSYFSNNSRKLRLVQLTGSLVWIAYGLALQSYPVVIANILNIGAILLSLKTS